jgi:ATP-binding cassette subfamily B multidrug efflux pump
MFRRFEQMVDPFRAAPIEQPPERVLAFYWHFVRQIWLLFAGILVTGLLGTLCEVALFAFVGDIVDMVKEADNPAAFFSRHGGTLLWMALVAVVLRPALFALHILFVSQAVAPNFTSLIRWQTHRYVLRQSLGFFQNDFAGRVATKVIQTGGALRESVVQATDAIWFATIYTISALVLFFESDPLLMLPLLIWLMLYALVLRHFVPRIKERAAIMSEARSMLTGRIVDSYTNIQTVKLFAHTEREDDYARAGLAENTARFHEQLRLISTMNMLLWTLNGAMMAGTVGVALWLWSGGLVTIGAIALAAGLVVRINNMSGWIMWVVTSLFENIGTVQDGIATIAQPRRVTDLPGAPPLRVTRGEIRFGRIRFHYGKGAGVIEDLSLAIQPGEKVGLVGRSGAGKSTLVNLLLRFHDLEGGRILIDGQDIAAVTQDSLRAQIGMVTQDTSLLHRSVRDNILYGRPDAPPAALAAVAARARADEFIPTLRDLRDRTGYDAHVGERGVKLSGGQRQRVAIARVLLKDAPILILDEATSALDSEVEAAIQEQLYNLMAGKTVIAIAHRLSTIAAMDRLVIMDAGRIVEDGSHEALLRRGGLYAQLWRRQSGGFVAREPAA